MSFIGCGFPFKPILWCYFHTHPTWEIIYQVTEHTDISAGGETYRLNAGELIVIPPDTVHNTSSDTPFIDVYIRLDKCDFPTKPFSVRDTDGSIWQLFNMINAANSEISGANVMLCDKLSELICLYIKKAVHESDCPEFILKFKSVLTENIGNTDFRLGEYIEKTGYNPDYFRRVFKQHTSYSPLAYLNRLRIDRAKELLRLERHLSIEEIAGRCGFRDSFYFSTAFKKQEGIPPRSYKGKLDAGM